MQFAHIGLAVRDLEEAKTFYAAALAPLGLTLAREKEDSAHFSGNDRTLLWLHTRGEPAVSTHLAFEAESREQVDAFYSAGLAAGGTDNGAPGIRENYSPNYYAAFLLDPDGHNIEAVFRG